MTESDGVYPSLQLGPAPADRPYVFINMVATIDGKTISGTREEPVADLGSTVDHKSMRQIESFADAVLIGAGSLRATKNLHYGPRIVRIVVSRSGRIPYESKFFTEKLDGAFIATCSANSANVRNGNRTIVAGGHELDWQRLLDLLRNEISIMKLVVEGGSEVNAELLRLDLVDEIFLTVAPLVKLGETTPTVGGGVPFDRRDMTRFRLLSSIVVGDEVFLRYQRHR